MVDDIKNKNKQKKQIINDEHKHELESNGYRLQRITFTAETNVSDTHTA